MSLLNFLNHSKNTPEAPGKTHILVVDDEQYLNDLYVELLRSEGYEVSSAFNGKEALTLIKKNPPHLILLDVMMPVMNGNEVLAALQENDATKRIPVIVLTNAATIENRANAQIYNVYKFFIKTNIDPSVILQEIKVALVSANTKPAGNI